MLLGAVTTGAFRKPLVDLLPTGIRGERGMATLKSTECFLSTCVLHNMSCQTLTFIVAVLTRFFSEVLQLYLNYMEYI